jgi:hypothetical protein
MTSSYSCTGIVTAAEYQGIALMHAVVDAGSSGLQVLHKLGECCCITCCSAPQNCSMNAQSSKDRLIALIASSRSNSIADQRNASNKLYTRGFEFLLHTFLRQGRLTWNMFVCNALKTRFMHGFLHHARACCWPISCACFEFITRRH